MERIERWLKRDPDPDTRAELAALVRAGDKQALAERFAERLAFGTAGLRGLMGAGPARMNRLVVRETTAGLGAYLQATVPQATQRGVVIGYDGRHGSRLFAEDASRVLTASGFRVWLGSEPLPTPVCAFAVRHLNAAAGVVVTASHNPPAYNGYKVYWENGAQIIPPHDAGIAAAIDAASHADVPYSVHAKYDMIGAEVIDAYLAGLLAAVAPKAQARDNLCVGYTPLHGVGAPITKRALQHAGFARVHVVAAQETPDGAFPTVQFPNPEEPGAMDAVIALSRTVDADVALAQDPDADRLAAAVRNRDGVYEMLTGDQVGALLAARALGQHKTGHALVATTIVSSRLLSRMAASAGAAYAETLTGFKWIANAALDAAQRDPESRFLFGYEEALGYTIGTHVRDKDGISALVALADLAADCKTRGKTLLDELETIYRRHGLYLSAQVSRHCPAEEQRRLVDRLRERPPMLIAGRAVRAIIDLAKGERTNLPRSNVLILDLDGARVVVRPSGTEPKLKCYYEVWSVMSGDAAFADTHLQAQRDLHALRDAHQASLT